MTKIVEITHYRTEQFTLTKCELIAALRAKYGDESAFEGGVIDMVLHQGLFGDKDDTHVIFKVDQA